MESFSQCSDLAGNMLTDEDYLNFMSDTLFSTITNHQPFAFPDCREIGKFLNNIIRKLKPAGLAWHYDICFKVSFRRITEQESPTYSCADGLY